MSISNTLRTIETPMGNIVCEMSNDPYYPAFYINLKMPDGHEVLLAAIEYNAVDKNIGICSYFDMSQDDPTYHDRINEEDIQQYLKEVE